MGYRSIITSIAAFLFFSSAGQPQMNRIRWQVAPYGAYQEALLAAKPLIVLFDTPGGAWCAKLASGALASSEVNALFDRAAFLRVSSLSTDKNAVKLRTELGIERYPTLVVLDVASDKIVERSRITGYFDTKEYHYKLMSILLAKSNLARGRSMDVPATMDKLTVVPAAKPDPANKSDNYDSGKTAPK
jgi:hypothetical protein